MIGDHRQSGECAVCHRIAVEGKDCPDCHWPIGEQKCAEKPRGFDVAILVTDGSLANTKVTSFKRMGSESSVRSYARMKRGFVRVLAMRPYTRDEWVRVYGEGRM